MIRKRIRYIFINHPQLSLSGYRHHLENDQRAIVFVNELCI